jgi:VWFA-related protein
VAQNSPDIRVEVDLVRVAVSVTDRSGKPVQDMRQDEFTLLDNGKTRPIQYIWKEADLPLTIGLVVDVSGSQMKYFGEHQQTMGQFLKQVLRPHDQAFLVSVAGRVRLITDLTNSPEKLQTGIDSLRTPLAGVELGEPCFPPNSPLPRMPRFPIPGRFPRFGCGGSSVLWHGIYTAARLKMKPVDGRKAMVMVSDGWDTGSIHNLTDAIEAAQGADTLIYTIRYPEFSSGLLASKGRSGLRRLSGETGGRAYAAPQEGAAGIFTQIEEELRNLYVLGFAVPETARDGKVHILEVKSRRKGVTLRARKSYSPTR